MTRKCHPEAKPKDLANKIEILHFAALRSDLSLSKAKEDSKAVTLATPNFIPTGWHPQAQSQRDALRRTRFRGHKLGDGI